MKITVELENNKQLDKFIEHINEFEKINPDIKFRRLKLRFRYDMKSSGEFEDSNPNTISINPGRCDKTGEFSFFRICIHEFSHLLDKKLKIDKQYKQCLLNATLYLTNYAKKTHCVTEEIAEIISCYLLNPYLLKLISIKHYDFISKFFKSTVPCTKEYFLSIYERYSPKYRNSIIKKYGINIDNNKIYKNGLLFNQ